LKLHKLTARRLAAAITTTKNDTGMKERLSVISKAIQQENGLQNTVVLIEKYFN
jgi:UDP:flavonoid glycosyltransferase YjiC (YdhE family)